MSAPLPALLRNSEKNFSCAFFHKNARKLCVFLLFLLLVCIMRKIKHSVKRNETKKSAISGKMHSSYLFADDGIMSGRVVSVT